MVDQQITDRFQNVLTKGRRLLSNHVIRQEGLGARIQNEPFLEWHSQSLTLLRTLFGPDHAYTREFDAGTSYHGVSVGEPGPSREMGVLTAAQEDLTKGWAWQYREVLHAEVFDDFLAMAEHLLKDGGYKDAAAVSRAA